MKDIGKVTLDLHQMPYAQGTLVMARSIRENLRVAELWNHDVDNLRFDRDEVILRAWAEHDMGNTEIAESVLDEWMDIARTRGLTVEIDDGTFLITSEQRLDLAEYLLDHAINTRGIESITGEREMNAFKVGVDLMTDLISSNKFIDLHVEHGSTMAMFPSEWAEAITWPGEV